MARSRAESHREVAKVGGGHEDVGESNVPELASVAFQRAYLQEARRQKLHEVVVGDKAMLPRKAHD